MRTRCILFIIISFYYFDGICQLSSKNSINYGIGIGLSDGTGFVGAGPALSLGYKRDIWKDRLKIYPSILVGAYRSEGILDVREQYFNELKFNTLIDYDIIGYSNLYLNAKIGGFVSTTRGLMGTGGEFVINESEYVEKWHYGMFISSGLNFYSKSKKYSIELIPLGISMGFNEFLEIHSLICLNIKI